MKIILDTSSQAASFAINIDRGGFYHGNNKWLVRVVASTVLCMRNTVYFM